MLSRLQTRFPQIVLLFVAAALVLTLAELLLMTHTEDQQVIAIMACGLGILCSLLGIVLRGKLKRVAVAGLLLVSVSGIVGAVEHREEALEHQEKAAARAETAPEEEEEHGPPPLAPLSLVGLGVLGALAVLARLETVEGTTASLPPVGSAE